MENKYYVYRHIRVDKNEPFYVGIGTKPKHFTTHSREYSRAYSKQRGNFWKLVTNKSDYIIEIIFESNSYIEVKNKEIEFVKLYGRKALRTGTLVNLTTGGEGDVGIFKRRRNFREVYIYDVDGKFLKQCKSFQEAKNLYGLNEYTIGYHFRNKETVTNTGLRCLPTYMGTKIEAIKPKSYRLNTIKVNQYTQTGILINEFESVHAAAKNNNLSAGALHNALTMGCMLLGGYYWGFTSDTFNLNRVLISRKGRGKFYYLYNLNNEVVYYGNIKEVLEQLGCSQATLRNYARTNKIYKKQYRISKVYLGGSSIIDSYLIN